MEIKAIRGKLALITLNGDIFDFSVRSIAAYLKSRNFSVSINHCFSADNKLLFSGDSCFSEKQLMILRKHCEGMSAVGISILTTQYFNLAKQINNYLKKELEIPIIWGGIPILCSANFFLEVADYVCMGEGEICMEEFLQNITNGTPVKNTRGIAYKSKDGNIVYNNTIPLLDINSLPIPYFDPENHYFLREDIVSLKDNMDLLYHPARLKGYRIFAIKGCPYKCAYCSNNRLSEVMGTQTLRKRNVDLIISELKAAKELVPGLSKVLFMEDDFFSRKENELEELALKFQKEIGLIIRIHATSFNIKRKNLDILEKYNISLERVTVGLQTPSVRVNKEIYRRYFKRDEFIEKIHLLADRNITIKIDTISANPYETYDDKIEAVVFYIDLSEKLKDIKDSHRLVIIGDHTLLFFPGTDLYDRALKDGVINELYINQVLLKERLHRKITDFDLDALILAIFRISLISKNRSYIKIMKNTPLLKILNSKIIMKIIKTVYFVYGKIVYTSY
jgi:radical SAM superfamily enzyme YgiQ (UPF0313 family)